MNRANAASLNPSLASRWDGCGRCSATGCGLRGACVITASRKGRGISGVVWSSNHMEGEVCRFDTCLYGSDVPGAARRTARGHPEIQAVLLSVTELVDEGPANVSALRSGPAHHAPIFPVLHWSCPPFPLTFLVRPTAAPRRVTARHRASSPSVAALCCLTSYAAAAAADHDATGRRRRSTMPKWLRMRMWKSLPTCRRTTYLHLVAAVLITRPCRAAGH
jgi:hypothetical protein